VARNGGHFALATGLRDALAAAGRARVPVSSVAHLNGGVVSDDIQFERRPYDPWEAYSQSKTANVLFVVVAGDGLRARACLPSQRSQSMKGFEDASSKPFMPSILMRRRWRSRAANSGVPPR
jgi:hypothetical protein